MSPPSRHHGSTPPEEDSTLVVRSDRRPRTRDGVHYLVVIEGREHGHRIPLSDRPVRVGRASEADVCLQDPGVSKSHCEIRATGRGLEVTDLGSTNGTYVDGARISGAAIVPIEGHLSLGGHVLKHEFRSRAEVESAQSLSSDIRRAASYVRALIPSEISTGAVRTEWAFVPCDDLGGDALGYAWIDERRFMAFLMDVSGHGVGAAMHSVSVFNALRNQTLPDARFTHPGEVLNALNRTFQMDRHGELYFTIWYGVYDVHDRVLDYASAGHPPALLTRPDAAPTRLRTRNPPIGILDPDREFAADQADLRPGDRLYLFSDGAFEMIDQAGSRGSYEDMESIVAAGPPISRGGECRRIESVLRTRGAGGWDDDLSLLVLRIEG